MIGTKIKDEKERNLPLLLHKILPPFPGPGNTPAPNLVGRIFSSHVQEHYSGGRISVPAYTLLPVL